MSAEMETDLIRINNQLCDFSRDGRFLAVAYQTNLILKDTQNFGTVQSYAFSDFIEYIEWSPNSEYILCANIKKAIVQVYSILYPRWKCKLIEGSGGLESVAWSPDSKHILTLSDFNIQISIWSLENQSVSRIQNVKSSSFDKLHFSPNGCGLAVIVTNEGRDSIEIYKTADGWKLSRKLICERLDIIDGTCWSPDSQLLCIWCSSSGEPKLIVYSTRSEKNLAVFCPAKSLDPQHHYTRELNGIENVTWVPSGQLLAITGFNEMVVLLNHVTWKPILQLYFDPIIRENNYLNKVYEERRLETTSNNNNNSTLTRAKHILREEAERPINIRISKKDDIGRLSIAKTDILEFSFCGEYLAIRHQLYPTTLWIWNVTSDYLDYLLLENNIVAVKWNPKRAHLLVFCECLHIFQWTPHGASCVPTPRNITVLDAKWHPRGKLLVLLGYNKAIISNIENEFLSNYSE